MLAPTSHTSRLLLTLMVGAALAGCGKKSVGPEEISASSAQELSAMPATEAAVTAEVAEPAAAEATQAVRELSESDYVVKEGDTLWDIADHFLNNAWYWPEIWYNNPQVDNPHLIYPGDVIRLVYIDGMPRLEVASRGYDSNYNAVNLSPEVRVEKLPEPIPAIKKDVISAFVVRPRIIDKATKDNAPYVVGSLDDHLIYGANDRVYVQNIQDKDRVRYAIMRVEREFKDPANKKVIGYEAVYVGEAVIEAQGKPATAKVIESKREGLKGDILLPVTDSASLGMFEPHAPDFKVNARVVSLFDAISQIGQYEVAVINMGDRDGIELGHVLATYQAGEMVRDGKAKSSRDKQVQLPSEQSGLAVVFRTFDHLSYVLIMKATRPVHVGDEVSNPR